MREIFIVERTVHMIDDIELLRLIENNARLSFEEIAVMLGTTAGDVEAEIKRLKDENIILGYNTIINWEKQAPDNCIGMIEVRITPVKNKGYDLICPLIDEGWDKHRCFWELERAGIKLPEIYTKYEFPNANCIGCVKSGSVWYWQLVRKMFPDVFKQRAEQSRRLGCRLVDLGKGNEPRHIFLDELPEHLKGRKPKSCYVECGIFCAMGANNDD